MFRLIDPSDFVTSPWKNGGGVTHEIARDSGPDQWSWRISIAEVASNGPFSHFAGLSRILTVIDGHGIVLQSPKGPMTALPLAPVAFSGELDIDGQLIDGPIRDLNVIYDAARISARVSVVTWPGKSVVSARHAAVLALTEGVAIDATRLSIGACGLGAITSLHLEADAKAIVIWLDPV